MNPAWRWRISRGCVVEVKLNGLKHGTPVYRFLSDLGCMTGKPKVLSPAHAAGVHSSSIMKKTDSPPAARRLASEVERARDQLAAAETSVQTAKHESRAAKRRRKLAKEAVRRTKKRLRQAKENLAEAKRALAKAEEKMAIAPKRPATGTKRVAARPPTESAASKSAKKVTKRVPSRARRSRLPSDGTGLQPELPSTRSAEIASAAPATAPADSNAA